MSLGKTGMMLLHFLVLLIAIGIGARVGGIAIGFAGGLGVLVLGFLGAEPGSLPLVVIAFITVVIVAVAAMQVAGGMDYLVGVADRILHNNPRNLALLAPLVTYVLTLTASTGQASFALMPVITDVAKDNDQRPVRALSVSVIASLLAITASPISAAVIFLSSLLEDGKTGYGFLDVIAVSIPATLLGVMITALVFMVWDRARGRTHLADDPEYQRRRAAGTVAPPIGASKQVHSREAKLSVLIFVIGLMLVLVYAILVSDKVGLIANPPMNSADMRLGAMLATALAIVVFCKIDPAGIPLASTFRIGMTACVCILGVAWLGTTFMDNHEERIKEVAAQFLINTPWMLAVVLGLAASLLYSQAATTRALMPAALSIGLSPAAMIASFPAASALFILPNYPTLLAAVALDDTGTTQLGKRVIDHPFILPGLLATSLSVVFGFVLVRFL